MIASWFVGYLDDSIYVFFKLAVIGSVIPITSSGLLLTGGMGPNNFIAKYRFF